MEGNYILREIIERRKVKQASATETTMLVFSCIKNQNFVTFLRNFFSGNQNIP